jgi:DNA polymerase-3 subunit epsilon
MVANMPVFLELANDINKFTKDTIFVAHNVGFDYRVIKKEFSRIGMEFQRKLLCTIELTKIVYPELKSYSLGKIASNLNIKIKNRHRADGDAMATLILFNKLRDRLGEQNLSKFVKSLE